MPPNFPSHSAALQALQLPFANGSLQWPADAAKLFLQAQPGWPWGGFSAEQPFKPAADALIREARASHVTCDTASACEATAQVVLVLPPRQREHARALFAQALDRCASDGIVVASVANDAGAKSAESDLRKLAGLDGSLSKHHCRVFWVKQRPDRIDPALRAAWRELDAPRTVAAPSLPRARFVTRPGVFAWDRIDPASALLSAHLPGDLTGAGADLGAGWGYLSLMALARGSGIASLDLYEADARALALARINLADADVQRPLDFLWHDVTAGVERRYDFVLSNPPFHAQDRTDRPELGQRFIEVAAQALRPGGRLYLVANRHLPYEAALAARFPRVRVLAQAQGFKAIEAVRGAR